MRILANRWGWLVGLLVIGCNAREGGDQPLSPLDPDAPPVSAGDWYRPEVETTWQWQLKGAVSTGYDVGVYDIDLFDSDESLIAALHGQGRKVVCYFSAGSFEDWRPDAALFPAEVIGKPLDGWEGESWLDVRSVAVHAVLKTRLDLAQKNGCDGVEPDNVDGFANDTGFELTATDQLAFNRFLANEARRRGLAVGLKNDGEQAEELVDYFDFSLNEQCHEFDECAPLYAFVERGKPVWNAEYPGDAATAAARAPVICPEALNEKLRTLLLPLELDDTFRISCDE